MLSTIALLAGLGSTVKYLVSTKPVAGVNIQHIHSKYVKSSSSRL